LLGLQVDAIRGSKYATRWIRTTKGENMMVNDVDNLLNHLLVSWHKWGTRCSMGKGYPHTSASCRVTTASREYDDDGVPDDSVMIAFDAAAYRVPQPYLTALQFQAKNMSGAAVWRSPRLPEDLQERAVLTLEARNMLMRELARNGVLS
jgi:hypothetical protein